MSRYTGSTWKVSRRLGFSISETGKELAKRNYAPGQHGSAAAGKKKKLTEYGKQLQEKQKVRYMYGVSERQFQRLYILAKKANGVTGLEFLRILESRLDNLVYRMGLARTRAQARQLVNHGHVIVDGKKVDIPSYLVKPNQTISLKETSMNLKIVQESLELNPSIPDYVSFDKEKKVGKFVRVPERSELNQEIDESLIVEFYNRKV